MTALTIILLMIKLSYKYNSRTIKSSLDGIYYTVNVFSILVAAAKKENKDGLKGDCKARAARSRRKRMSEEGVRVSAYPSTWEAQTVGLT